MDFNISKCRIWRFRESNFQYIIRAFGADSPLASSVTCCLMFTYRRTPYLDKTNDDTESV